jgi:hypothetical protein
LIFSTAESTASAPGYATLSNFPRANPSSNNFFRSYFSVDWIATQDENFWPFMVLQCLTGVPGWHNPRGKHTLFYGEKP